MSSIEFVRTALDRAEVRVSANRWRLCRRSDDRGEMIPSRWRASAGLPYAQEECSSFELLWSYVHWNFDQDPTDYKADPYYSAQLLGAWETHAVEKRWASKPFYDADVAVSFLEWLIRREYPAEAEKIDKYLAKKRVDAWTEHGKAQPAPSPKPEPSNYMKERNERHWDGSLCALNAFEADHDATAEHIEAQKRAAVEAEEAERQRRLNTLDDWDLLPDAEPEAEKSIVVRPK